MPTSWCSTREASDACRRRRSTCGWTTTRTKGDRSPGRPTRCCRAGGSSSMAAASSAVRAVGRSSSVNRESEPLLAAATGRRIQPCPRSPGSARPPRRPAGRAVSRAEAACCRPPKLPRKPTGASTATTRRASQACPTDIDIPTFIKKIATGNLRGSRPHDPRARTCSGTRARASVRSRCLRGRLRLQRARPAADRDRPAAALCDRTGAGAPTAGPAGESRRRPGKKVALIGAGPASLACAGTCALEGHEAVIYERARLGGGLNTLGIAPYKLQAADALDEVAFVGVARRAIVTGVEVGRGRCRSTRLLEDFDAVFLGVGLGWRHSARDRRARKARASWARTALIERVKTRARLPARGVEPRGRRRRRQHGDRRRARAALDSACRSRSSTGAAATEMRGYDARVRQARRRKACTSARTVRRGRGYVGEWMRDRVRIAETHDGRRARRDRGRDLPPTWSSWRSGRRAWPASCSRFSGRRLRRAGRVRRRPGRPGGPATRSCTRAATASTAARKSSTPSPRAATRPARSAALGSTQ